MSRYLKPGGSKQIWTLVVLLSFPLGQLSPASPAGEDTASLPAGRVIDRLICREVPDQSYALYLPSRFDPEKGRYPVLFALDPRGRALIPMERFQAAAEKYGYVVASSYNSASDVETDPNFEAWRAMWEDLRSRVPIDENRMYWAGFSGTVRAGCDLATRMRGKIAGILGAGAGWPSHRPPRRETPFDFFGTVGEWDFNYFEMVRLEQDLEDLGLAHRIAYFAGGHDWMGEDLAASGLEWMELRAMEKGLREKESGLIESLWSPRLARAGSLECEGNLVEAHRQFRELAADFEGLRDVTGVQQAAARLGASPEVREAAQARRNRIRDEEKYLGDAWQRIGAASHSLDQPANLRRLISELKVAGWRKRAQHVDTQDGKAARRVLNSISVQTSFYLPRQEMEKENYPRAAFFLAIAAEIEPENPRLRYRLASAQARAGRDQEALRSLKVAVEIGWSDAARIEQDPAFEKLRQKRAYKKILARLQPFSLSEPSD